MRGSLLWMICSTDLLFGISGISPDRPADKRLFSGGRLTRAKVFLAQLFL